MISLISRWFKGNKEQTLATSPASQHSSGPKQTTQSDKHNGSKTGDVIDMAMPYGPNLLEAARSSRQKVRNTARQRLGALLDSNDITLEQLKSDASDAEDLLALCSYNAQALSTLIDTIDDQNQLAAMANAGHTPQQRKAAAERVTERKPLEAMLKAAKGHDKNVYRIAKEGLAKFKAEDKALAAKHEQLTSLCVDAERHAKKPFDPLYTHKFVSLEEAWQAQESHATPELQTRFESAIAKCQSTIDAELNKSKAAALAEQQQSAATTQLASLQAQMIELATVLSEAKELPAEPLSEYQQQLNTLAKQAHNLLGESDAPSAAMVNAHAGCVKTSECINQLIEDIKQAGTLSSIQVELKEAEVKEGENLRQQLLTQLKHLRKIPQLTSVTVEQAEKAIAEWEQKQKEKRASRKAQLDAIGDLSRRANIAARNGQVRRARGIYRELSEKREKTEQLPLGMQNKLEELDEAMAKLGDWHDFAVTPKKEALIEKMTALQSSPLAPDDLADKIHALQDEWKLLCKGGQNQDEELWQAFQKAADTAFEPCRKHFSAQAEMREKHAESRRELISQLEQYHSAYDWEKAVWKDVEQTLRVARDTWKSYWPVPRQDQKALQAEFDATLDKIYAPMNTAYDAVKTKKQQLIELARKASENTDSAHAAEELKKLQNTWKNAGRTYRKADQALWSEFRKVCDGVFEQRKVVFDQANAERETIIAQGNEILENLKTLHAEGGKALATSGEKISTLKQQFAELNDLPKQQIQAFNKILHNIDSAIDGHRQQAERGAWLELFEINKTINDYELAPSDMLQSEIEDCLQSAKLPSGCESILHARIQSPPAEPNTQTAIDLKLLCIRAEIATGKESPEADKNVRMTHQVAALQKGLGTATQEDTEALAREWITHKACPADELEDLQQRFTRVIFANK